jgi:hypothetical protein
MPPRYAYWTILIDGKATAFRAREREELLPTFNQLARKNADIAMRYFARGRLWDTPEQAQWANRNLPATGPREKRGRDWRPGGEHKDPRARFGKSKARGPAPAPAAPFTKPKDGNDKPPARFSKPKEREAKPGSAFSKPKDRDAKPGSAFSKPKEFGSRSPNRFGRSERRGNSRPRRKLD